MKIYLTALVLILSAAIGHARTYSLDEIPNVHLADTSLYVSNPDGIISPQAEARINDLMRTIRRGTSAEPVVVVIDDFEGDDIDIFATELFEKWGLGKSDKDNGLLILVAKDRRKAVIRPGYGLEGVLPDILCANILKYKMFPSFREGDFSGGMTAAGEAVTSILTDPDAAEEIRSAMADADLRNRESNGDFFGTYLTLAGLGAAIMLIILIMRLIAVRGKDRHTRYMELAKLKPLYLALTFAGLFIPLVASVPLLIVLYRLRNTPRRCPHCGTMMRKVDEVHDNEYLNPAQDLEEHIGSVDYDVWRCPSCGETDIEQYVNRASGYTECAYCHAHACKLERSRVIQQPTTRSRGQGLRDYRCMHCHKITSLPYIIPMIVTAPVIISGGGNRGGFGGGGSFGGGFGGGHTGGGGASGGW